MRASNSFVAHVLVVDSCFQAKTDLSRFVRWPRYIRIQRQKKILFQRLKIPPSVNVFRNPLDRAEGKNDVAAMWFHCIFPVMARACYSRKFSHFFAKCSRFL